ncbi:PREDICTED: uncharacterized protein LOC104609737 [Nelumbo nucifera]|uniref:Uncharacterized protein n=2 Tax=Nelumbo nucifera TaxID=4432 RepID=A0A822XLX7_NELNU|nr:PREDICTED: uncharacterized protein LOC104609737 [Nelumbo nucifera]DAD21277.1 TPA_asm: hypothetical protein HUJ06_022740 [Nelumbo nucifera]
MEAEEVLQLYDHYWFNHQILTKKPPSSPPVADPVPEIKTETPEPESSRPPALHVRSRSDELSSKTGFRLEIHSPNSVLPTPKLETILSGKEVTEAREETRKQEKVEIEKPSKKATGRRRRKKKGSSKSLSDLEFEELKGFMDLGFVFSEEDKDSSLVSIIPGLQRLGKKDVEEEAIDESTIPRPYLSEAWGVLDQRKERNPLMNWRIPPLGSETDMKDHLRFWAHTVASTVR